MQFSKVCTALFFIFYSFNLVGSENIINKSKLRVLEHSWVSEDIEHQIWSFDIGDFDNDKKDEFVLITRNKVFIAQVAENSFKIIGSYKWKENINAYKVYAIDIDSTPGDEIIVSGMEQGVPTSFILKWNNGKFSKLLKRSLWHLRSISTSDGKEILIGQKGNSSSVFSSKVFELKYQDNELRIEKKINLPLLTNLYDFAFLPEGDQIVTLRGYESFRIFEKKGKKLRKKWASSKRYGGSLNNIETQKRVPLGVVKNKLVSVNKEPVVLGNKDEHRIFVIKHDMPLKNIIGERYYIRAGNLVIYKNNSDFGYLKELETEELPGYITDFLIYKDKIIAIVQPNVGDFINDNSSKLIIYDIN